MKKSLLIAVIFFAFFISGDISGQQNTINNENAPKSESVIDNSKPGNVNPGPNNLGAINADKPENSAKESTDIQKTQKQKIDNSKNTIIKGDENSSKTEQKQLTIIKPVPDRPINGNGLLEINDGDFNYKRIPGISLNVEKPIETPIAEKNAVNDTKDLSGVNDNKEKSSFGIKKSTAVIILLILLIVIIIVFKIRSKTTGDKNVLRRFPGMK